MEKQLFKLIPHEELISKWLKNEAAAVGLGNAHSFPLEVTAS